MACSRKDLFEHSRRKAPGISVVATAVIRVQHCEPAIDIMLGEMPKLVIYLATTDSLDDGTMCDSAERDHDCTGGQGLQLGREKGIAGINLYTDGLVVGRQALDGVTDSTVLQLERVVG